MLFWIESELKQGDEIEYITSAPDEVEETESYEEIEKVETKETRNIVEEEVEEDDNEDIDYDATDNIDNEISSSSPSPNNYPINQCRGDDIVECPKNPQHKICEVHLCDGVNHCPGGEDESPEQCSRGENDMLK